MRLQGKVLRKIMIGAHFMLGKMKREGKAIWRWRKGKNSKWNQKKQERNEKSDEEWSDNSGEKITWSTT